MRVNSQDLISRQTQLSARWLAISSATVMLVEYHSLDPSKWGLLNDQLTNEVYRTSTFAVLMFSIVSLLIHWRADYSSYTKWFKTNEVNIGTLWGNSQPRGTEPPMRSLERRLQRLGSSSERLDGVLEILDPEIGNFEQAIEKYSEPFKSNISQLAANHNSIKNTLEGIKEEISGLNEILDELQPRFESVDFTVRFTIFVWYLTFPFLLSAIALFLLFSKP